MAPEMQSVITRRPRNDGFTIIELITVMVILGILSVGTVTFISDGANGFASTLSRGALASDAQLLITRLNREIREALPSSIRISAGGDCLELIPITGGSVYLSAPVGTNATGLQAVPLDSDARVAIAPVGNVYQLGNPGAISPTVSVTAIDANNEVTINFANPHQFTQASALNRFFLVAEPISYCLQAGALWRYQNYGFNAVQLNVASLPNSTPQRALLAESINSDQPLFSTSAATLQRNATVALDIEFERNGDRLRVNHSVQLRNLP